MIYPASNTVRRTTRPPERTKPTPVTFTPESARRLKAVYTEECKTKTKNDSFLFDGNEYVLGYAKYLIEYLELQFGKL